MRKPIVIVGGGIGGLCTGIRLLHAGYPVLLFEKNNTPGGALSAIMSPDGRFTFQESASIGINPLTFFEIFTDVEKIPSDYFQWDFLDTLYHVFVNTATQFDLPANLSYAKEVLRQYYPSEVEHYTRFILQTSSAYLNAKKHLLSKPFLKLSESLHPRTLFEILKTMPYLSAEDTIKRLIHEPTLQHLLLFQAFFMGTPPSHIPGIYSAIPARTQTEGMLHIRGGLYSYIKALVRLFEQLGGKLYCDACVSGIHIQQNEAKGIMINESFIPAHKVIVNTDYLYSQSQLLPYAASDTLYKYPSNSFSDKLSCSTFVMHMGLSCRFPNLQVHNLYASPFFHKEMQALLKGKLIGTPSLYLYYPSAQDDSLCQNPNESTLNVMIRVPHLGFHTINWTTGNKYKLYHLCVDLLCTLPGLSALSKHIAYHHLTTPMTYANRYHYTEGSCFGLASTYKQNLMLRPQIVDPHFKNLYYVGASIHPGSGASIVMDGAKLLANHLICEEA